MSGPRGSVADYDRYGSTSGDSEEMPERVSAVRRRRDDRDYIDPQQPAGIFRDDSGSDDDSADGFEMSVSELLYSTSSFYAIVVPGMFWALVDGLPHVWSIVFLEVCFFYSQHLCLSQLQSQWYCQPWLLYS